jgi:hypothetical protein
LEITFIDQNQRSVAGIPLEVSTPITKTYVSDESGRVLVSGPAGNYEMAVPSGCTDDLEIQKGTRASARLVGGARGSGTLRVTWRHRISPKGQVRFRPDEGRSWNSSTPIEVSFDVVDRCNEDQVRPSGKFRTFRFDGNEPLEVLDFTGLADERGRGNVVVKCRGRGIAQLIASDESNPTDRFEMFRRQSGPIPVCD